MNRPMTITVAAILVVVLMLFSAVWPLVDGDLLLGIGNQAPGGAMPSQNGRAPQGMTPAQGNMKNNGEGQNPDGTPPAAIATSQSDQVQPPPSPAGTPPAETREVPQGVPAGPGGDSNASDSDQDNPSQAGTSASEGNDSGSTLDWKTVVPLLRYVLYAIVIVCGLISFGGLWAWRLWGNVMAIVTSVVATGTAFFELFNRFSGRFVLTNTTDVIETVIKTILAIGVIILVILPSSKPTGEREG